MGMIKEKNAFKPTRPFRRSRACRAFARTEQNNIDSS